MIVRLSRKELKNYCKDNENCIFLDCNIYEGQNQVENTSIYLYNQERYETTKDEYYKKKMFEYKNKLNKKIIEYLKNNNIKNEKFYNNQVFIVADHMVIRDKYIFLQVKNIIFI